MRLTARRLEYHAVTDRGVEADVAVTESNGDTYVVRGLCMPDGRIDIGASDDVIRYLDDKYGADFVALVRQAVSG